MSKFELIGIGFTPEEVDMFLSTGRSAVEETVAAIRKHIAEGADLREALMREIQQASFEFASVATVREDAAFLGTFVLLVTAHIMLMEERDARSAQ